MTKDTGQSESEFGKAVRIRRLQLGVTLDQLAENSGVSAAALSRVERGLLSPSLRNASAIAKGLGCGLSELVEAPAAEVTRHGDNLVFTDATTGISRTALARPNPKLEYVRYHVPAGVTSARFSAHDAGTKEIFHILAGELEVHTASETIRLSVGDTAILRVDCEHWFSNVGRETVELLLTIFTP